MLVGRTAAQRVHMRALREKRRSWLAHCPTAPEFDPAPSVPDPFVGKDVLATAVDGCVVKVVMRDWISMAAIVLLALTAAE